MEKKVSEVSAIVNKAIKEGYYPEEDILNGPRLRVIPTKVRCLIRAGISCIHMCSDIKQKEPFCISLA